MDRTQPNRMYLLAGTSDGHVYPLPPGTPPLNVPTIFDVLQARGISWKVYVPDLDLYNPHNPPIQDSNLDMFTASIKYPQNFAGSKQYFQDVANNTLPQVAMVEAGFLAGLDEHPNVLPNAVGGGVQIGSNFVSTLINALMGTPGSPSPSWKDSVFILTWDEGGAFYDHVPPYRRVAPDNIPPADLTPQGFCYGNTTAPTCGFDYTGFRVPPDRGIPVHAQELRLSHQCRLHRDPEADRNPLRPAEPHQARCCPDRYDRILRFH
jgi:phospholipase C